MSQLSITIISAYILDLLLGDPCWFPHPVKGIGWLIKRLEIGLRRIIKNEFLGGIILAFGVVIGVWGIVFIIIYSLSSINQYLGLFFSTIFIYTSLAIKDLKVESLEVYDALMKKDLIFARQKLSLIVGRDTENLNEQEISRATIETIAENTVDGIISPLFYAFIGGAPLALAYKAANTLDSMVGYKNETYRKFGWMSAKLDDIVNYIPARLCILFLPIASWIAGKNGFNSFRIILRDGRKNPSPNSGFPEAGFAGALGIELGGVNYYNSIPCQKPVIGKKLNSLETNYIKESIKISYICCALFLIVGIFLIG